MSFYSKLKEHFPTDTVDVTRSRILVVSKQFAEQGQATRVSRIQSILPSTSRRLVLVTPTEVKQFISDHPCGGYLDVSVYSEPRGI